MLIMGLDTSLQRCSVAILRDDEPVGHQSVEMARGHAERLAPMVVAALSQAGVKIADLDRIGVTVGPGGFTGVRIALSFARGLAIGSALDVVGVTSLAALAETANATNDEMIAPLVDARRGQVYAALYGKNGKVICAPFVAAPEQALNFLMHSANGHDVVMIGTGAGLVSPSASWRRSKHADQIDARAVARLAAKAPSPTEKASPVYLRAPDAKPQPTAAFLETKKK